MSADIELHGDQSVFDHRTGNPAFEDKRRSALVSRVILFQFKLFADCIRDVVLSPVSILAGLAGLLLSPYDPHKYFNMLTRWGVRTDRWINLFDNHGPQARENSETTLDDAVADLEEAVRRHYKSGDIDSKVRKRFDDLIQEVRPRRS